MQVELQQEKITKNFPKLVNKTITVMSCRRTVKMHDNYNVKGMEVNE